MGKFSYGGRRFDPGFGETDKIRTQNKLVCSIHVSQGGVATHVSCGGILKWNLKCMLHCIYMLCVKCGPQCILHYMVRSKEAVGGVSREVVDILLHAGLIKK